MSTLGDLDVLVDHHDPDLVLPLLPSLGEGHLGPGGPSDVLVEEGTRLGAEVARGVSGQLVQLHPREGGSGGESGCGRGWGGGVTLTCGRQR